jgi:hypothetical protein
VFEPQGADSLPPPLRVAKTGKNHLNEEITPLLPTGIGERFSQTISNLGHGICKLLKSSAYKAIPTRFLALIDYSKIPALRSSHACPYYVYMHRGARPKVSLRCQDLRLNTRAQND